MCGIVGSETVPFPSHSHLCKDRRDLYSLGESAPGDHSNGKLITNNTVAADGHRKGASNNGRAESAAS